ncbi:MAG TPA: cupin domain-containing protein [Caulobacteraceae bacterium]|nr:cupin domain-containing protein [Caulobacteraceae bacterium]
MDPLSQTIALLHPQTIAWRLLEGHDGWALRAPANDFVVFGQMIEGACEAVLADGTILALDEGDFLLMHRPKSWVARTARDAEPVELKAAIADPGLLRSGASDPRIVRLMAGAFVFGAPNAALLDSLAPSVVHVRAAEVRSNPLGSLLRVLMDEGLADRPGRSLVLDRLLEIMLVEALRRRPDAAQQPRPGLLAGLADPKVGAALALMHADARRAWTVAELARGVGMSRSAFAARFAETIGAPPMDYLLGWRMMLARDALVSSKAPLAQVAELAGYASVSAFSTAFSRANGQSPSRYARTVAPPAFPDPMAAAG